MRSHRAAVTATTGLAALALLLGSCTTTEPEPSAEPAPLSEPVPEAEPEDSRAGGTLRVGLYVDPVSIDPRFVVDDEGELIVDALFDPLVRIDPRTSRVLPAAADRWEIDDRGRTFTFHLRASDFHDGTPVTAEDFKRSFDRIADGTADPPSFLAFLLSPVAGSSASQATGVPLEGVEVVDPRTLRITLDSPQPGFLATLTDPSLVPVPPSADEDLDAYAARPIGNGPFAMAEPREPNTFLRLSRFADHPDPPLLDEVLLQIYTDDPGRSRQWEDFGEGLLQVAEVPPERFPEATTTYGASADGYRGPGLLTGITSTVYLYGFDTTRPPFDDPRIRRAVSLAIDREALADEVMQGSRAPATAIVPPPILGAQPDACQHCRHDPEAAAALLAEVRAEQAAAAGEAPDPDTDPDQGEGGEDAEDGSDGSGEGGNGSDGSGEGGDGTGDGTVEDTGPSPAVLSGVDLESITLTHNRGRTHTAIAERIAADIQAALDIEVDFQARDLQPFVQEVRRGDVPVFRLGWDVTEPRQDAYLYPLFHSSQVGLDNLTRYANDEVDALLDEARTTTDAATSIAAYRQAERAILDDAPALPLLWYRHGTVVAPTVEDLYFSPLGRMDLARAWLAPSAR